MPLSIPIAIPSLDWKLLALSLICCSFSAGCLASISAGCSLSISRSGVDDFLSISLSSKTFPFRLVLGRATVVAALRCVWCKKLAPKVGVGVSETCSEGLAEP